ncbi:MAG: efflux RND transporter permease subunit [Burkholderiaceae bacterium]
MNRLIALAIRGRVFANLLMVGLIVAGAVALTQLTVKTFPDIALGTINISVAYPGAAPREVADSVIAPIENKIRSVEGVRRIISVASQSRASINASLTRAADIRDVRDEIETRLAEITALPQLAERPIVTEIEPREVAIQFIVAGQRDYATLKDLARQIRDELLSREGISAVDLVGVPADEIAIEVPGAQLRALDLSLTQIADRVGAQVLDLSGGVLRGSQRQLSLRTLGERLSGAEIGRIVVLSGDQGSTVELADIARITDGLAEQDLYARLDGAPAVFVNVLRNGDEQTLEIVDSTRRYLDSELRPRLPDDIRVVEWRNEAQSLRDRIRLLTKNAVIGALLILLLLTLALDLRIAAWVSAGIVIAFSGAIGLMAVFGITINQLSLFGFILALGIVVDDAIVVGEAIYSERQSAEDSEGAAERGAARMARPVFYSVATTITAFVPLLFLPGTSGSFITPVAAVVIMVLTMSLLESFFILPHHLAQIRSGPPRRFSPRRVTDRVRGLVGGRLDRFASGPVRRYAAAATRQPVFVVLVCFGLLAASLALVTSGAVRFVFFPEIEGDFVAARLEMPAGTAAEVTDRHARTLVNDARRAAAELARRQGLDADRIIDAIAVSVGFTASSGGDPDSGGAPAAGAANQATIDVKLLDAEQRSFTAKAFSNVWREVATEIPGARQQSFSASLVGVGAPISLQISAPSEAAREAAVAAVRRALEERRGVYGVRVASAGRSAEIAIRLRPQATALGVPVRAVASELRAAVFGATATRINRDGEEVELRVRLPEDERDSRADLADYRVKVNQAFVPLSALATLDEEPAPTSITRVDTRETTTVEADVQTELTTGSQVTGEIVASVLPELRQDYPGVTISLGGEQEEQSRFGPALAVNFLIALFGIYALLAMAFQSYTKPALIVGTIAFGFVGALVGHALLGLNLTLLSMFGMVGLSGIVINSSLLLLNEIDATRSEDEAIEDTIADAVASRFRPIALTTLTTFFGVSPLILETSPQAQFLIPTAVSLGFGVLSGAVFVMTIMPAYASLYFAGRRRLSGRRGDRRARENIEPTS